jgi:hypothetical protein
MLSSVCTPITSNEFDGCNEALNAGDTSGTVGDIKQSRKVAHVGVELSDSVPRNVAL